MTSPLDGHGVAPAMGDPGLDLSRNTASDADAINTSIADLVEDAMARIMASHRDFVSVRENQASHDFRPFVGVADHIYAVSSALSRLTADLTADSLSRQSLDYATTQAMSEEGGLADIDLITTLDRDMKQLEHINDCTQQYQRTVGGSKRKLQRHSHSEVDASSDSMSPVYSLLQGHVSPASIRSSGSATSPVGNMTSSDRRSKLPHQTHGQAAREKSPPALSDKDHFANFNLDQWKRRGKGDYYCPRKYECTKGGVNADGELVKFERNSAYVQHCNKHKRPFICDRPGCPNPVARRSFARADGLRRHQEMVPHGDPCKTEPETNSLSGRNSSGSQETVRTPGSRPYLKPENNFIEDSDMNTAPQWFPLG